MATITRPSLFTPHGRSGARKSRAVATPAAAEPSAVPPTYTRSPLPLALSWFVLPAIMLVVSLALGWPR